MAELSNLKHEKFCQEYVKDGVGSRAYRAAYGSDVGGADQAASRLLKRDDIRARIQEIRDVLAAKTGMSQEQIVADLESIFEMGKANPERGGLAAAHQAKAQQAKILGYTSEKKGQPAKEMTDEELVKQYRKDCGNDRLANLMAAVLKHSRGEDITEDLDRIEADLRLAAAVSHSNGKGRPSTIGNATPGT